MSVLSESGFSTAVFAPAWAYEHFPRSTSALLGSKERTSIASQVDESLWTGVPLPEQLTCDCKGRPHHTEYYRNHYITRYAQQYPAGSSHFFETNFAQAFQPLSVKGPGV